METTRTERTEHKPLHPGCTVSKLVLMRGSTDISACPVPADGSRMDTEEEAREEILGNVLAGMFWGLEDVALAGAKLDAMCADCGVVIVEGPELDGGPQEDEGPVEAFVQDVVREVMAGQERREALEEEAREQEALEVLPEDEIRSTVRKLAPGFAYEGMYEERGRPEMEWATRATGNTLESTPGADDIDQAKAVVANLREELDGLPVRIWWDTVDQWTMLHVALDA